MMDMMSSPMMAMLDKEMPGMDMMMMQQCMESFTACEQSCTMCADMCASSGMEDMAKCMAMCMNTADMCHATMRMMMRPSGMDSVVMMKMLEACMMMARACAEECMKHDDMEHMKACAQVCMDCAKACESMMGSMTMMMAK